MVRGRLPSWKFPSKAWTDAHLLQAKTPGIFPAFIAADEASGFTRCGCALVRRGASALAAHLR